MKKWLLSKLYPHPLIKAAKQGDLVAIQNILDSIDIIDSKYKALLWEAYVIIVENHYQHSDFKKVAQRLFHVLGLGNRETQINAANSWMFWLSNGCYRTGDLIRRLYDFNYRLHDSIETEEYEKYEYVLGKTFTPAFERSRTVLQQTPHASSILSSLIPSFPYIRSRM